MRKLFTLGVFCILAAFVLPALAAQPEAPADGLKMQKSEKKVVVFNHSTHKDMKCVDCHHPVDGKEDYRPCATAGCHDVMGQKDKSVKSYYQAMHKAKDPKHASCVSCHTEKAGADKEKKKELVGCAKSKCHP